MTVAIQEGVTFQTTCAKYRSYIIKAIPGFLPDCQDCRLRNEPTNMSGEFPKTYGEISCTGISESNEATLTINGGPLSELLPCQKEP